MAAIAPAAAVASSARAISEASATNQFVTFTCANRALGIEIMSVREIRSWSPTTLLPGQSYGAEGVLDIRGSIVEVYDLATMLGSPGAGETPANRVVLVVSLGDREVGLTADSVSDIIFAGAEDMRVAPNLGGGNGGSAISMLIKNEDRLIGILNLNGLFPSHGQ